MRFVVVLALTGCSYFATEGPRPPPMTTGCNLEMTPVVADAVFTVGAVLATMFASIERGQRGEVLAPAGVAGVFGASSVYGFVQVHRCRTEHAKRPGWSLDEMPAVM